MDELYKIIRIQSVHKFPQHYPNNWCQSMLILPRTSIRLLLILGVAQKEQACTRCFPKTKTHSTATAYMT